MFVVDTSLWYIITGFIFDSV